MDPRLVQLLSQIQTQLKQGFPGLVSLIAVIVLFALAGAAVSRDRTPILMTVRGWVIATVLAIALPLFGVESLSVVLLAVALLAILGVFALLRGGIDRYALIPSLILGAPLLLLGCTVQSTFLDAYIHWLPNAQYLVQMGHLIAAPLPPGFFSLHPTYPPALALPVWIASRLLGEFASGTAQALTTMLIVLSVPLVARFVSETSLRPSGSEGQLRAKPWTETLLALMAIVLLNPGAHDFAYYPAQHNVQFWSVVADPPLSILAFVTLLVLTVGLSKPQQGASRSRLDPVSLFALGALPAAIKPGGEYLVAVIAIAAVWLTVVARLDLRRTLAAVGWLAAGAIVVALLWKAYKLRFDPIQDLRLGTPGEWRLGLLLPFLRSCAAAIGAHIPFYLLIAGAFVIGIRAVLSHREKSSALELLLVMSSVAFAGHLATLTMAYVMTVGFGEWEVRGAYSWQRYASQAGLAACAATILWGLSWIRASIGSRSSLGSESAAHPLRLGALLSVIAGLAYIPVAVSAVGTLRYYMKDREGTHQRALADLSEMPANVHYAVAGHVTALNYVLYAAWADMDASHRPWQIASIDLEKGVPAVAEKVNSWTEDRAIDCILLVDAEELSPVLGLDPLSDHLRCNGTWRPIELRIASSGSADR
jgi:hypothetical protein